MKKIFIKKIINKLGLLPLIEQVNFFSQKIKSKKSNDLFRRENPDVKLPPDFYMYETFHLNYDKFYTNGKTTTQWLIDYLKEYIEFKNIAILDWGCGTGRILRHFPGLIDETNSFYGADYNEKYVKWCAENLENITVKNNNLKPPLSFEDNSMNLIYGISIFTHFSEELHFLWMKELVRVLKNKGILFLTTHGDAHSFKLLSKEAVNYKSGRLVVHSYKKEGNRLYASYQSPIFFKELCLQHNLKVLKHTSGDFQNGKAQQDKWVLQLNV